MIFIQTCTSQATTCNKNLTKYWSNHWKDLKDNKTIFLVLSRSTNTMIDNATDLLQSKVKIVIPIVIRPSTRLKSQEIFEIIGISRETAVSPAISYGELYTGMLISYGRLNCQTKQKVMEQMTYGFHTLKASSMNSVTLFQTCQMTMTEMEKIEVQPVWVLFISVATELQISKISANISFYIEAAEMLDYSFDEFEDRGVETCEKLMEHLKKCEVLINNSDIDIIIVSTFLLIVVAFAAAKTICCLREIRSNQVHNISEAP